MDEDLLCFYNLNFIASNPLTPTNILTYFSLSQFYDRKCLNEILKMQTQFANIDISHKLTTTPGIYYSLDHSAENLFIIAKKENDGRKTVILKMYYCISGYIFYAPTINLISETRTVDILSHLDDCLNKYEEKRTFHWLKGSQFRQEDKFKTENQDEVKFLLETLHEFETKNHK